jgi:hypothetical protein
MAQVNCIDKKCPNYGKYIRYCNHALIVVKEEKPIAKKSKERERIDRKEYGPKARKFVKDHPISQAHIEGICSTHSQCVHHKKGKNSKEDLLDEKFWLAVCFPCHRAIEENPDFAKKNGFSVSRHSKTTASK